jgi:hypothetical protein
VHKERSATTSRLEPSRAALGSAGFQLWMLNVFVGTLVGSLWLLHSPKDLSFSLRLYVSVALVSSVATLAIGPGLLFYLAQRALRSWRWLGATQAGVGALFLGLLYTDTIVYRLLRYHFNGAFLNVAFTPGSGDAIHLGAYVWITAGVVLPLLTVAEYLFWRWRLVASMAREERGQRTPLLLQPRVVCLAFLLPLIFVEKSVYAAADLAEEHELFHAALPVPGFKMRLSHLLDPESARLLEQDIFPDEARLDYPHVPPALVLPDDPPSFLVLVLDSWRRDHFTPELTPRLAQFAQDARVFEDHVSGGNGTRYGLFTLLYGLHGAYWSRVLEEQRSPVLIDELQRLDYDVRVFSAASMNFPEFLPTAWRNLPREHVLDAFVDERGRPLVRADEKDVRVADAVAAWARARDAGRPFFGFVLLDSPHQPYYNPGGPHQPAVDQLNYIELGRTSEGPELEALQTRVRNTYRNSVLHADAQAGRILDALAATGALDDTVVIVTGDHGEEFYEHGFWGHTSNFSSEQVDVPFILRGPGVSAGVETRPTTHLDVSNTLLEFLGADPACSADYSLGASLLDPPEERARVFGAWAHVGVDTPSGIFQIPLEPEREPMAVFDRDWTLHTDLEARFSREREALERIAAECVRFLRVQR